ncbi:MAG TPA: alpha-amylase family glycosyl hydrolase, partial [Herpetosiphonaceae bacterium]
QAMRLSELPHGAWPCNTLGNHDTRRVWSRYGDGIHDAALARLHVALILTLKGTPFLYNGEEIGMSDLVLSDLSEMRDTMAILQYHTMVEQLGKTHAEALSAAIESTRDRCRSPMQWSDAPNSGFSPPDVQPWLPVNANYASGVNVAAQLGDPGSLLSFYRRMLRLRRATPALIAGDYHALHAHGDDYLAFLRHDDASVQTCLVVLNFTDAEQTAIFDQSDKQPRLLFSSHPRDDQPLTLDWLALAPFEVLIVELA